MGKLGAFLCLIVAPLGAFPSVQSARQLGTFKVFFLHVISAKGLRPFSFHLILFSVCLYTNSLTNRKYGLFILSDSHCMNN